MDRKTFFEKAFTLAVGKSVEMLESNPVVKGLIDLADEQSPGDSKQWERPPGAVDEALFKQRCTGCDQCMIACPHNVIMVADMESRLPVIYPEEAPCLHCDGYPCAAVCETGALEHLALITRS